MNNEIVGYIGSVVVLLSFLSKDMFTLRTMSIIGCVIFIIYGFLIKSYPTVIVNSLIIVVNSYKLYKEQK